MKIGALVYQAGIANVFQLSNATPVKLNGREEHRMLQGDFRSCEYFARGLKAAGWEVWTFHANVAGDVANVDWQEDLDGAPFSEKFHPVGNYYRSIIRCPECNLKEYQCSCGFMQYLEMEDEMRCAW